MVKYQIYLFVFNLTICRRRCITWFFQSNNWSAKVVDWSKRKTWFKRRRSSAQPLFFFYYNSAKCSMETRIKHAIQRKWVSIKRSIWLSTAASSNSTPQATFDSDERIRLIQLKNVQQSKRAWALKPLTRDAPFSLLFDFFNCDVRARVFDSVYAVKLL